MVFHGRTGRAAGQWPVGGTNRGIEIGISHGAGKASISDGGGGCAA